MKPLAKWIVAGLAFALGVMAAEHCNANQIRQIRSLNASIAPGNGASFTNPPAGVNPFYVPAGGVKWTVVITLQNVGASYPILTYDVEIQMTDGTWVALIPTSGVNETNFGGSQTIPIVYHFEGPFQDMRVNLITRAGGQITADIFVEYVP